MPLIVVVTVELDAVFMPAIVMALASRHTFHALSLIS